MLAFSQVILGTQYLGTDLASRNRSSEAWCESSEPRSVIYISYSKHFRP